MHDDRVILHKDDTISGRLVTARDLGAARVKAERDLVIGAAQQSEGDALPAAGDRSMHMAEKEVTDASCMGSEAFAERCPIGERDRIHRRDTNVEGRMMHEQQKRLVRCTKRMVQPGKALLTI